jgi:hypothetical protein
MPGRDRTGPLGTGPMFGRGMGYCGSYSQAGFANSIPGFRNGFGFRGRGWRRGFFAADIPSWRAPTPEQETADLKAQADWLKGQLDAIQKRIEEIESK